MKDDQMFIVDSHTHIWSANVQAYPWAPHDGVPLPDEPAGSDILLGHFDRAGVTYGICIQPRVYGYDHAYLNNELQTHANRLAGVCIVNPLRPNGPGELKQLVREHGYRGLRLNPMSDPDPVWLDGPKGEPLWLAAAELDVVVSVLIEPNQLERLYSAAVRYAHVAIVVDHLGRCTSETPRDHVQNLIRLANLPNVSVKISALSSLSREPFPYTDLHPLIEETYQAFGPERLLWGTDFPHILAGGDYQLALNAVQDGMSFIDRDDLPAILGGNTARLYKMESLGVSPSSDLSPEEKRR